MISRFHKIVRFTSVLFVSFRSRTCCSIFMNIWSNVGVATVSDDTKQSHANHTLRINHTGIYSENKRYISI